MRVLVTGGTGFVGSHTVAALAAGGHEVRVLARDPARVAPALGPLGVEADVAIGDILDRASVEDALTDCDAVIHAASVYTYDRRRDREIARTNVEGTRNVLDAASRRGLDPIVHVSSIVALLGDRGATLTADSPPGDTPGPYFRSKAASERVAREFQRQGAPVAISYPAMVWGPHDPYFGESCLFARVALQGKFRFSIAGGFVISDVRDVAALHAQLIEPGRGPRRYLATGARVTTHGMMQHLSALTGRNLRTSPLPPGLVFPMIRAASAIQRIAPFRLGVDTQGVRYIHLDSRWDDSATKDQLGITPREVDESLRDTLTWLYEQGHISRGQAGRIAEAPTAG